MNNKYSKENVSIGDHVLVNGSGLEEGHHWGEVIQHQSEGGVMVVMDNKSMQEAEDYDSLDGRKCYYAYWSEVHDHIPANKVAMHEGKPVNVEDHGQPASNPLQKVIDGLTATHRYLEQVTGKKYSAQLKGFDLESGNGYESNTVTIKFVMEEK